MTWLIHMWHDIHTWHEPSICDMSQDAVAATLCNTLQHTATRCNTLQQSCVYVRCIKTLSLQHTATHCNTLQHTATVMRICEMHQDAVAAKVTAIEPLAFKPCEELGVVHVQPIPLWVTFSNAVPKLKAQSSNVSFHWNVAKETFELWALSFRKCQPKWDWLYLYYRLFVQCIGFLCSGVPCAGESAIHPLAFKLHPRPCRRHNR